MRDHNVSKEESSLKAESTKQIEHMLKEKRCYIRRPMFDKAWSIQGFGGNAEPEIERQELKFEGIVYLREVSRPVTVTDVLQVKTCSAT